ncbi:MAG: hypothetical protein WD042_13475 [Phycisphaeraceae bacterium]
MIAVAGAQASEFTVVQAPRQTIGALARQQSPDPPLAAQRRQRAQRDSDPQAQGQE